MSDKYESGPKSTGGLWVNRNKQPNSKQPDMVGNLAATQSFKRTAQSECC